MAKCGITWRYPVRLLTLHDDGSSDAGTILAGDAENLAQAVKMAECKGFHVRDDSDGGNSRFVVDPDKPYFIVTVYPNDD